MTAADPDPAHSTAANLLVIAPPGCGKTQLLARRAAYLIPQLRPNQRILALTFSNKARDNLADRIRSVVGSQAFRRYIRIRNFHGHATELLRAHGATIGLDPGFTQPTDRALGEPVRARFAGLSAAVASQRRKAMDAAMGWAKQQPLDDQQVMELLVSTGNADALAVERAWRQSGILSYGDLLRHVQRLLHNDAVANLYQHHYGAVLVDEFQDLSPQQLDIALRTVTTCRTFVGDPLQGIYTWAGARPVEVEAELRNLCGPPLSLTLSYRSSPTVLSVVNAVSAPMGGLALTAAEPARWPGGGAAASATFATGIEEGCWIAQQCVAIMARDPAASIGVIARAGWRRRVIDSAFASSDVPFTRWDLAIDNPIVVDILRAAWRTLPARSDIDALERMALSGLPAGDSDTVNDVADAITDLRDMAADTGSVTRALAQLHIRERTEAAAGPGVHLLNAHTGKGQQFDWVFIPGVEDFHMPSGLARTEAERAEEDRVLLVMLSRARHAVTVSRARSLISNAGRPYSTGESAYWQLVAGKCPMVRDVFEAHIVGYKRPE